MEKRVKLCFAILAAIGACCSEAAYWIFPENPGIRTICKAVTAVCILACAFSGGNRKGREFWWTMSALAAACAADVIIVSSFPVGAGLFALAHICLVILFYKQRPLTRRRWLIWGGISACLVAVILALGSGMGIYAYGAAVYAPILILMVFTAINQKGIRRIAAFIFLASDLLLALYQWKHIHLALHVIYMGLFYAAMLMFAWRKKPES
ncbi:MAG: hypothetical protein IKG67_07880 [Parasporobacterium sp.]|nr:hypothetical protein [Parasporobacterium sp.]